MAQLDLGTVSFSTRAERDKLAILRSRYTEVGLRFRQKFLSDYSAFKTADVLFQQFPERLEEALSETVNMAASDIAANHVYDISISTIRADLDNRVALVQSDFKRVQEKYFEILGKAAELETQRRAAMENRGGVVGGGFGVEGAAGGIILATVANAAIGLTYGLANLTAKAASALGDSEKKRELFVDPATKDALADFLCRAVLQGCEIVAETVNRATGTAVFDVVSGEHQQKSTALVENATSGRVPEAEIRRVLVQSLELDPFGDKAWNVWIEKFGDKDGSVAASAKALGVQVAAYKSNLISQRRATLAWSTPEECRESSGVLEDYAAWVGFPFDTERARIAELAEDLDRTRCTFNGVLYPTLSEATAAREAHEDTVKRTVKGVTYETINEAEDAREHIREQKVAASSASSFWGWATLGFRRCWHIAGRSSRREFWSFVALSMLVFASLLAALIIARLGIDPGAPLPTWGIVVSEFGLLFLLICFICYLTLQIRRFHDLNLPGWLVLLNMIPYIGWAIVLLIMFFDGTRGDNKFGPSPN